MTAHTIHCTKYPHSAKYPINRWALLRQDLLMISAFGIWTTALGLLPVFLVHVLAVHYLAIPA
ncbi:MAG TPA: hypothetical protein VN941_01640 [Bradyrhizobium sp.]|nr:hypothetical protein [Bradyrhizobium sp.]